MNDVLRTKTYQIISIDLNSIRIDDTRKVKLTTMKRKSMKPKIRVDSQHNSHD